MKTRDPFTSGHYQKILLMISGRDANKDLPRTPRTKRKNDARLKYILQNTIGLFIRIVHVIMVATVMEIYQFPRFILGILDNVED
jgi:hypothetical protein